MPQHEFAKCRWLELSEDQFSVITSGGVVVGKVIYRGHKRGKAKLLATFDEGLEFSEAQQQGKQHEQHERAT